MKKKVLLIASLSFTQAMNAQIDSLFKNTRIAINADMYYNYNIHKNDNNLKTSFIHNSDSFELGMISTLIEHQDGKIGITADLGFGNRAEEFSYNDTNSDLIIKQLYIDYQITKKIKITAGSWATHVGYELIDAYQNKNYSMSYGFSYGPFFHTGVKANVALGDWSVMLGVADPTDFKSAKEFDNKYVIGQVAYEKDKLSAYLNGQIGSNNPQNENISQVDLTVSYDATDKINIGFDGTYSSVSYDDNTPTSNWSSIAGYLGYAPNEAHSFNYRAEYFSDKDNVKGIGSSIFAQTITYNYSYKNFTLKPEFRYEFAKDAIFLDKDGKAIKNDGNFLIAVTYNF